MLPCQLNLKQSVVFHAKPDKLASWLDPPQQSELVIGLETNTSTRLP